jgi:hypothetical protein
VLLEEGTDEELAEETGRGWGGIMGIGVTGIEGLSGVTGKGVSGCDD